MILVQTLKGRKHRPAHPDHLGDQSADLRGIAGPRAKNVLAGFGRLGAQSTGKHGWRANLRKPSARLSEGLEVLPDLHKRF